MRNITTNLYGKTEAFKMCALAEATGLGLLIQGVPGTGKTNTVLDYARSWLKQEGGTNEEAWLSKVFILETDEETKDSAVKGTVDVEELFTNNKFKHNAPITEAEVIIINEIDKASSTLRNALLGIMSEKMLWNGKDKIKCKWKLFIGTCNEIPKDEIGSPFWDRFMLKYKMERMDLSSLVYYHKEGGKNYKENIQIHVPSKEELQNVSVNEEGIVKALEVFYKDLSDRTLSFVPTITAAIKYVWNTSYNQSLIKTAAILVGPSASMYIQDKLYSKDYTSISTPISLLESVRSKTQFLKEVETIKTKIEKCSLSEYEKEELLVLLEEQCETSGYNIK